MKKVFSTSNIVNDKGFSLVEVILASALFLIIVTTFIGSYLYGQESTALSGSRARATLIAEEGLEAVRNIRDNNFDNLNNGTHGLSSSNNIWELNGSDDTTDIFTREIEISEINNDEKEITSTVTWQQTETRNGLIALSTTLTNWGKLSQQNFGPLALNILNVVIGGGNRQIQGLSIENISTSDVTIISMNMTWGSNTKIKEVNTGGIIWSENKGVNSGTELDIADQLIPVGSTLDFNNISFSKDITGDTFSITVTLSDNSVESLGTFTP